MNDIEKIIQIFESGQYKLALELANGIKLNHLDLLQLIYDKNLKEVTDEWSDIYGAYSSEFGDFEIVDLCDEEYDIIEFCFCRQVNDSNLETIMYKTLQQCFKTLLYKIEVLY